MSVTSINSYSALNFQRLSPLLRTTTRAATSDVNSLISNVLKAQNGEEAQSTKPSDGLSMLQQLMGYINTNNADPVFEIGADTGMDKSGNWDKLFNITGSKNHTNPMNPFFEVTNPAGDIYSKLMNIRGLDSTEEPESPVFNSNFALLRALQKSGMKSDQITEIFEKVQNSTRYNNLGTVNYPTSAVNSLFSAIA
ncbi:MAG: hypothetical protein GX640_05490 [Fibrobacter sp.]|nr:hypothetical protein [Fibrobacter sp.]